MTAPRGDEPHPDNRIRRGGTNAAIAGLPQPPPTSPVPSNETFPFRLIFFNVGSANVGRRRR
eukprot:10328474-Lingulodinium_polyedra.AAC.1